MDRYHCGAALTASTFQDTVSRDGIVPISFSQDTPGPMCRTVRDVAILLSVMAGEDPADPATRGVAARVPSPAGQHAAPVGARLVSRGRAVSQPYEHVHARVGPGSHQRRGNITVGEDGRVSVVITTSTVTFQPGAENSLADEDGSALVIETR